MILIIAAAAIIYLILTLYADYDLVIRTFEEFNWVFLPLLLLLTYFNFVTRFIKWHYYLKVINVKIALRTSYSIFMSGLVMSITPGKMGELVKSYMVKRITGDSISKTAPIVIVERITDFISLILLAIIGAYVFDYGKLIVIGTGVFFLGLVLIISNKKASLKIIAILSKIKFLNKYIEKLHESYNTSYELLKLKPLASMILVSLVSWFFECLGFYLILVNFNLDITVLWSTFVYAFSTIAGSITMLPAGLGVTEGSLTFLLVNGGVASSIAVASTFIIRSVTLWFALLVGIISLYFYQKEFGKINFEKKS
jgi:uncharacterized protein (TIRG00374 family)